MVSLTFEGLPVVKKANHRSIIFLHMNVSESEDQPYGPSELRIWASLVVRLIVWLTMKIAKRDTQEEARRTSSDNADVFKFVARL